MLATSIDGAEHGGILKGVMAVAQINRWNQYQITHQMCALIDRKIRHQDAPLIVKKIATSGRPRCTHTLHATCTPR